MSYIKDKFKTNIKFYQILLYLILGAFISLTINSIFIHFGLIKLNVVEVDVSDRIPYYIALVIRIITSCIIGPFLEELIFRGFIFDIISKRLNKVLSIILTTFIFAALHFSLTQFLFALFAGTIFIIFYVKTKNLLVSFLIHFSCNVAGIFVMFANTDITFIILYLILTIILFTLSYKLSDNIQNKTTK